MNLLDNISALASEYYLYLVIALCVAVFVAAFSFLNLGGEFILIQIYKARVKKAQRIAAEGDSKKKVSVPIFPEQFTLGVNGLYLLVASVLGVIGAGMAQDWLLSPVILVSFIGMGYGFYRGQQSSSYVTRRAQLADILRILGNNLETYQSVQIGLDELYKHYTTNVDKNERDQEFERNLKTLCELMVQEGNPDVLADRIFGSDAIYQQISKTISIALRSGLSNAIEYSRDAAAKLVAWRGLVSAMNTEVGGIRLAALVLELLLVGAVFVALLPSLGEIDNMIHDYFFASTANKMFLTMILFAHTIVQIGFMEFIKVNSESI